MVKNRDISEESISFNEMINTTRLKKGCGSLLDEVIDYVQYGFVFVAEVCPNYISIFAT